MADKGNGKSRGSGPVAIGFLDAQGKVHKRPVDSMTQLVVMDKVANKQKVFDYSKLPDAAVWPVVGIGLAGRLLTNIRNSVKNKEGTNVITCAEELFGDILEGNLFKRKEGAGGGPKGRPFDYELWREVMAQVGHIKGVKLSDKQLDGFVAGLKALSPAERKTDIAQRKQDGVVVIALNKTMARRAEIALKKAGGKSDYDALAGL